MADIGETQQSEVVRIANPDESNLVEVSSNSEVRSVDTANNGGVDSVLTISSGATVELKVGGSARTDRKYVQIQALGTDVKWGYTISTQSFDAFKSQFFILPIGDGTTVYIKNNGGSDVDVAIAEIS
jgi:hypothetical protein